MEEKKIKSLKGIKMCGKCWLEKYVPWLPWEFPRECDGCITTNEEMEKFFKEAKK